MGGLRTINGFDSYDANTWSKNLPDIEARIQTLTVDSVPWTEQTGPINAGDPIPPIAENKWYLDRYNKILYLNVGNGQDANTKTIQIKTYFNFWGEWATQTEMVSNELFQLFNSTINISLRYVKIPILIFGNPTVTSINMELQSLRGGLPSGKVLAVSNSALSTVDWGANPDTLFFLHFLFNDYGIRANTDYALVLKALGTFNDSNHLAWGRLDLVYLNGVPTDMDQITTGGNRFAIIGTKL